MKRSWPCQAKRWWGRAIISSRLVGTVLLLKWGHHHQYQQTSSTKPCPSSDVCWVARRNLPRSSEFRRWHLPGNEASYPPLPKKTVARTRAWSLSSLVFQSREQLWWLHLHGILSFVCVTNLCLTKPRDTDRQTVSGGPMSGWQKICSLWWRVIDNLYCCCYCWWPSMEKTADNRMQLVG